MDRDLTDPRIYDPMMATEELYGFIHSLFRIGQVESVSTNGRKVNLKISNGFNNNQYTGMVPVLMSGSTKLLDYKRPQVGDTFLFLCAGKDPQVGYALPYIMDNTAGVSEGKEWHVKSDEDGKFELFYDHEEKRFKVSINNGGELILDEDKAQLKKGSTSVELGPNSVTITAGGSTFTFSSSGFAVNGVTLMVP